MLKVWRGRAWSKLSPARFGESKVECNARAWEDVEIVFLSEFQIQINICSRSQQSQNYAELGFANKRSGNPVAAWETLRELAKLGGVYHIAADSRKGSVIEKRIQEIRKVFRVHFGLSDDPFVFTRKTPRNREDFGYRARFKIRCHASYGPE